MKLLFILDNNIYYITNYNKLLYYQTLKSIKLKNINTLWF